MGKTDIEILKGIIPRSFEHIMTVVASTKQKTFMIRCSYIEIYNEEIRDLLSEDTKAKREVKESAETGVFIKDLNQVTVRSVKELVHWMDLGNKSRSVGETAMNAESSRSHSIFTAYVETMETLDGSDKPNIRAGKLNLVDLAGSERQSKTMATGDRLKEANKINLSLSALGNVISALVSGKSKHIPYRDSKLTRLLQDSLGGNTKTLMICALSPADYNYEETLSTLKYGNRAKQIKNAPKVNEDPKDAQLRDFAEEISKLKKLLAEHPEGLPGYLNSADMQEGDEEGQMPVAQEKKFSDEEEKRLSLLEKNAIILDQEHVKFASELRHTDEDLEQIIKNRQEMEEKIKQMQDAANSATMQGGDGNLDCNKEDIADIQRIQKENEQREKDKEKTNQNRRRKTKELLKIEKTESVEEMTIKYREMQKKYKQICYDVRDAERENYKSKEEQLDQLRGQDRELDFSKQIVAILLSENEQAQIREKAKWNEEYDDYLMKPFFFVDIDNIKN